MYEYWVEFLNVQVEFPRRLSQRLDLVLMVLCRAIRDRFSNVSH